MRKTFTALGLAAILVLSAWSLLYSQEDMKALSDPAFEKPSRAAVPFRHEEHNAKAKLADCSVCHHVYKDGKPVAGQDSAGTKCSECHPVKAKAGSTPLMRAYHRQCADCHGQKAAGPVTCAECHPRDGAR